MLDWLADLWPVIDREWNDVTLSQRLAETFHVDTRAGRVAFTVALAAGSYALHRHIVGWRFSA